MKDAVPSPEERYFHRLLAWRRIRVMLATCLFISLLMSITWKASFAILVTRLLIAGLIVLAIEIVFM